MSVFVLLDSSVEALVSMKEGKLIAVNRRKTGNGVTFHLDHDHDDEDVK